MPAIRLLTLACLALVLGACTQKPQSLELSLNPPEPAASVSGGPAVALETVDRRPDKTLGTVASYNDKGDAPITTDQDVAYVLKVATGETLKRAGFQPELWSDGASPRLIIEITTLNHEVTADIPRRLRTEVTLTARAWRGGERFTAKATASHESRMATAPGPERNASEIERGLRDALRQLFDQRLVDFLAGRG